MTKRIFKSISLVALTILVAGLTVAVGVLYEYFVHVQKDQLKVQTELATVGIENSGAEFFEGLETDNYRITWIDSDGSVLFDTDADESKMENHSNRPEVIQALKTGYGESSRSSETLMQKQIYCAKRLSDGTVARVSGVHLTVLAFLLLMLRPFAVVIVAAIIISLVLASRLAKQIVRPLNALNLDEPLANDTYEELAPLLIRIEKQHRLIDEQRSELSRRQNEFNAITDCMNEGLVLLNSKGMILGINKSALKLLGTDENCIGTDLLTIERSPVLQAVLKKAQSGKTEELNFHLAGGDYQLNASPVITNGRVDGVALLFFNVTDKSRSEQIRREFTANVSHELKTPLHSISGCAELLKNNIVKPEDVPSFVGQIYDESQRLIALVEDIIRLSRLDEGSAEFSFEPVDLIKIAEDTAAQLKPYAEQKNVVLSVEGESAEISAIPLLIQEIIYNLCDNAIKYNRDGGSVEIKISKTTKSATLTVSDTGIGIPEEHRSRVFERFYRVDKSHSREIGGTGLGLSIVKHAAFLHNAKIELQSKENIGTKISVIFPLK